MFGKNKNSFGVLPMNSIIQCLNSLSSDEMCDNGHYLDVMSYFSEDFRQTTTFL